MDFAKLRMRFSVKKIQDWTLKSERIRKRILSFFIKQINPRSLGSWCVKRSEESISRVNSSVRLMHHDPSDLGLICLITKDKIRFRFLSDLRIQSWIFLKNLPKTCFIVNNSRQSLSFRVFKVSFQKTHGVFN